MYKGSLFTLLLVVAGYGLLLWADWRVAVATLLLRWMHNIEEH